MPKHSFEETDVSDDLESEEPPSRRTRARGMRGARGKSGGSLFASVLARVKAAPAAYWVLGLGASALAVDYFIEGDNSIASSMYRGIFGPSRKTNERPPAPAAAPSAPWPAARTPRMPGPVLPPPAFASTPTPSPVPYYLPTPYRPRPVYYPAMPSVYRTPISHAAHHGQQHGQLHLRSRTVRGRPRFGHRTGYDWE